MGLKFFWPVYNRHTTNRLGFDSKLVAYLLVNTVYHKRQKNVNTGSSLILKIIPLNKRNVIKARKPVLKSVELMNSDSVKKFTLTCLVGLSKVTALVLDIVLVVDLQMSLTS